MNTSYPASILHVDRHVQSQHSLESFTVYIPLHIERCHPADQDVDDIAGDEAYREKDQDA